MTVNSTALLMHGSPQQLGKNSSSRIMLVVIIACLPALSMSTYFFGIGALLNVLLACFFALLFETLAMGFRGRSSFSSLSDNSAVVTAVLLGLAMPPGSPWWLVMIGIFFAIIVAKQFFGGLGQNVFNPAMCGYAMLLLTFPLDMTAWHLPAAAGNNQAINPLSLSSMLTSLHLALPFIAPKALGATAQFLDGFAMATPLIEQKMAGRNAIAAVLNSNNHWLEIFNRDSETGWEMVNMAYLVGGLLLMAKKIISWHIPVAIIFTIMLLSMLFYSEGTVSIYGSSYLHLFGSATMIAAFFIATDPVSAAVTPLGKIIYGVIIGVAIYSIRVWGSYLDSIAFAVLMGNFFAPLIDRLCAPRIYGHIRQ